MFEREIIELRAFKQTVERTSPEVASAVKAIVPTKISGVTVHREILANPLTADEFADLNGFYALQKPTYIAVRDLIHVNKAEMLVSLARKMYRELLVRLAHCARDMSMAPHGLAQMPSILELKRWYQLSFHDLHSVALPHDKESCIAFDHCVRRIYIRHYNVSCLLCKGLLELAKRESWEGITAEVQHNYSDIETFFDEFCTNRARLRFLIGNFFNLCDRIFVLDWNAIRTYDVNCKTALIYYDHASEDFVGLVCKKCSLVMLVKWAIRRVSCKYPDIAIKIEFTGDEDYTYIAIPYMMGDIISAMLIDAAKVVDRFIERGGPSTTCVTVTLAQVRGSEHFSLRVSDTAGGSTLEEANNKLQCWSFYDELNSDIYCEQSYTKPWTGSPIRLAYASRVAHLLGGHIDVASIDGYGIDRYLYLPTSNIDNVVM